MHRHLLNILNQIKHNVYNVLKKLGVLYLLVYFWFHLHVTLIYYKYCGVNVLNIHEA
jgi:hypothetical protein